MGWVGDFIRMIDEQSSGVQNIGVFDCGPITCIDEALDLCREVLERQPDNIHALEYKGCLLALKGELRTAISSFKKIIELDRNNAETYDSLGLQYYQLNDLESAAAMHQEAVELQPDNPQFLVHLSMVCVLLGQFDRAIACAEQCLNLILGHMATTALENIPADQRGILGDAYYIIGYCYNNQGLYKEAVNPLSKSVRANPEVFFNHYQLGVSHNKLGNVRAALLEFDAAVKLAPDQFWPQLHLGMTYGMMEDVENAFLHLNVAYEIDPESPDVHYNLGLCHILLKQYPKALEYFNTTIKLCPDFVNAYYEMGVIYYNEGDYKTAAEFFSKVTQMQPDRHDSWRSLGLCCLQLDCFADAAEAFERASVLHPEDTHLRFMLAKSLIKTCDYRAACPVLESIQSAFDNDPEFQAYLGGCYEYMANYEQAIYRYERAFALSADLIVVAERLIQLHTIMRQYRNAAMVYEKLLEQPGDHTGILGDYRKLLGKMGGS